MENLNNFDFVIEDGGIVCYNSLARRISGFKSGGNIDILLQPTTKEGLINILKKIDQPYQILGACTNTLISDSGVLGIVLTTRFVNGITVCGDRLIVNCGELLPNIAKVAKNEGLSGFELLCGIPGSVGGGVAMNCGAYGSYISDNLEYIEVFDDNEIKRLTKEELKFSYRDSLINHINACVLSVCFKLAKSNKLSVGNKMKDVIAKRRKSQPNEPSIGCVFKKYNDKSAGEFIEKAGLKGVCIGGAAVSEIHGNFIVNMGGATTNNYLELVGLIEQTVSKKFGIILEKEIKFIGKN